MCAKATLRAMSGFDAAKIARYDARKVASLMDDSGTRWPRSGSKTTRNTASSRLVVGDDHAVEHEAKLRRALDVDGVRESNPQKRRGLDERAFGARSCLLGGLSLDGLKDEMNLGVSVIDGQNDSRHPNRCQFGIRHLAGQQRAQLFENETL
jgi:hypothetical protein